MTGFQSKREMAQEKTSMTKEALKLALEALDANEYGAVRIIIHEALAQPVQEPFEYWNAVEGWVKIDEVREHFDSVGCGTIYKTAGEGREPLYTALPQRTWVGLTDEEIKRIGKLDLDSNYFGIWYDFAKAIEAKLREKNT
jgi:hypothetical protein